MLSVQRRISTFLHLKTNMRIIVYWHTYPHLGKCWEKGHVVLIGVFWALNSLWAGVEGGTEADTFIIFELVIFGIILKFKTMQNERITKWTNSSPHKY